MIRSSYKYHTTHAYPVPLSQPIFYSDATEVLRNVFEVEEKWFAKRKKDFR